MKLKNSAIQSVGSIIKAPTGNRKLKLRVTFYQRPYQWSQNLIQKLFHDYFENKDLSKKSDGKELEYFLGAIVLVEKENSSDCISYEIVDGQQRLTTIYLMNFLKFILLKGQVEEHIISNISSVPETINELVSTYEYFIGCGGRKVKALHHMRDTILQEIYVHGNAAWTKKDTDSILKRFRKTVGLPAHKDLSDEDKYIRECIQLNTAFLKSEKMNLDYTCRIYNPMLKEALSRIVIVFSQTHGLSYSKNLREDKEEWPFVDRAYDIFDCVMERIDHIKEPVEQAEDCIRLLDEMINKLSLCKIITLDSRDAYKLFETLNDRAEKVSDKELMKDHFYCYYVNTSNDKEKAVLRNMGNLDETWNDSFKNKTNNPKEFSSLVCYCSVCYITGRTDIPQNAELNDVVETYLRKTYSQQNHYSIEEITRDFNTFNLVGQIFNILLPNGNNQYRPYETESIPNASIVLKTLALLYKLEYYAVMAGVVCDVISFYQTAKKNVTFSDYLDAVFEEEKCLKDYRLLWDEICVIWKGVLLGKNYLFPKKYSDALISARSKGSAVPLTSCIALSNSEAGQLKDEFTEWIGEWKFSNQAGKIKIKVLFLELYTHYDYRHVTSGGPDILTYRKVAPITLTKQGIHLDLDHIEGRRMGNADTAGFFMREHQKKAERAYYIDSLGNMMILNEKSNTKKGNLTLEEGIHFYQKHCAAHWLIDEMNELYLHNRKRNEQGREVPLPSFFDTRKERLIKYFTAIIIGMDAEHKPITVKE